MGHSSFQRSPSTGCTENCALTLPLPASNVQSPTCLDVTARICNIHHLFYTVHTELSDCTEPSYYVLLWTRFTTNNDHILDPARHHIGTRAARLKATSYVSTSLLFTECSLPLKPTKKIRPSSSLQSLLEKSELFLVLPSDILGWVMKVYLTPLIVYRISMCHEINKTHGSTNPIKWQIYQISIFRLLFCYKNELMKALWL